MPRNKGIPNITYNNVPLDCGHTTRMTGTPPSEGDTVYCRKCDDYHIDAYKVACTGSGAGKRCFVRKDAGHSKLDALRWASAHLIGFPDHILNLKLGGEVIEELSVSNVGILLAQEREDFTRDHQAALKNLGKHFDVTELDV
jgi:hypothetical protein